MFTLFYFVFGISYVCFTKTVHCWVPIKVRILFSVEIVVAAKSFAHRVIIETGNSKAIKTPSTISSPLGFVDYAAFIVANNDKLKHVLSQKNTLLQNNYDIWLIASCNEFQQCI